MASVACGCAGMRRPITIPAPNSGQVAILRQCLERADRLHNGRRRTDTFPPHIRLRSHSRAASVCVIRTGERKQTGAPRVACRLQHTGCELFRIHAEVNAFHGRARLAQRANFGCVLVHGQRANAALSDTTLQSFSRVCDATLPARRAVSLSCKCDATSNPSQSSRLRSSRMPPADPAEVQPAPVPAQFGFANVDKLARERAAQAVSGSAPPSFPLPSQTWATTSIGTSAIARRMPSGAASRCSKCSCSIAASTSTSG